jgi:aminopeptidase N
VKLDAKGMKIKSLGFIQDQKVLPLQYTYDSLCLNIKLDRSYKKGQKITLFISYVTLPDVVLAKGKHALNFINPDESKNGKPTQVWTNGEPENNSSWFPTIDKPNQKTTQDLSLTVPAKYTTLSNGALRSQKTNKDGTHTDRWVMDLPHAPYLFMLAVGKFSIVKDSWHGKEVSYYVDPLYAKNARTMFLNTVEAIDYFSKLTGIPYPWNKYSQVKLYDFGGAMENTTASAFGDNGQNSLRELADRNYDSGNIHELFHQWFGDYVTAESWANITLNESFADLSEILWAEHKYSADVADDHLQVGLKGYLSDADGWKKPLVRYHYDNEQDVFDGISYQKGGRILNMLRHYIGNDAFYKGLHIYLKTNAFKSAEVTQLRLALEEASGLDLNWFFDQWFFGAGHPLLTINYAWDEASKTQHVYVKQTQEGRLFTLPVAVDLYANGKTERHQVWLRGKVDTLSFKLDYKPDLVNVDAEKILVAAKTDNKTLKEFAFQYLNAPLYLDRFEAIGAASTQQSDPDARSILNAALKDKYYGIRMKAITTLDLKNDTIRKLVLPALVEIAAKERNNLARAEAIKKLEMLNDKAYTSLLRTAMQSSSYTVQGAALSAIGGINKNLQFELAKKYEKDCKGKLQETILDIFTRSGKDDEWNFVYHRFTDGDSPVRYTFTRQFADMTSRVENPAYAQQGITAIKDLVIVEGKVTIAPRVIAILNQIKVKRGELNDKASVKTIDDAISEINAKVKK